MIKVSTVTEAWDIAYKLSDAGVYVLDEGRTEWAGYPIHIEQSNPVSRICDLGCRLEVMKADGSSFNVWIEPEAVHYGDTLTAKIRETVPDFSKISEFDKFVLSNGYKYETERELQTGYDRFWKAQRDILLTMEEFLAEAEKELDSPAADTYKALVKLVEEKKLRPGEVFDYAHSHCCLNHPKAIIAYQIGPKEWAVNNCDTEITEEQARIKICKEWGFEAGRVHIIGTPYYDATDYQFIRFDGPHMSWLWHNGGIDQVFC